MTPEEAIKYLTPIVESASLPGYKAALGLALDALRSRIGEGCEACGGSHRKINLHRAKNLGVHDAYITTCDDGTAIFFESENGLPAYIDIGFCPVCGRILPVLRPAT